MISCWFWSWLRGCWTTEFRYNTWIEGGDWQVFECQQSGSVHERDQDVSTVWILKHMCASAQYSKCAIWDGEHLGGWVLAPGYEGVLTMAHLSTTLHWWWIFWWLWYHTLWAFSFKLWPRSILGKNLCSKYLWAIKISTSVFGRELYAHESTCWLERMHVSGIQLVF